MNGEDDRDVTLGHVSAAGTPLSVAANSPLPTALTPVSLRPVEARVLRIRIRHGFLQGPREIFADLAHDAFLSGFLPACTSHACRVRVPCPPEIAFRLSHRYRLSFAGDDFVLPFMLHRELPCAAVPAQLLVQPNLARRESDASADRGHARTACVRVASSLDFRVDLQDGVGAVLSELFPPFVRRNPEVRREVSEARDILGTLGRSPWTCQLDGRGPAFLAPGLGSGLARRSQHQRNRECAGPELFPVHAGTTSSRRDTDGWHLPSGRSSPPRSVSQLGASAIVHRGDPLIQVRSVRLSPRSPRGGLQRCPRIHYRLRSRQTHIT